MVTGAQSGGAYFILTVWRRQNAGDFATGAQPQTEACQRALDAHIRYFVANVFYYFAKLAVLESHGADPPAALARKSLAVSLLSCVRSQPATWQIYRDKTTQLQAEIAETLPAEMLASAIVRGQGCTLEDMVSTLLGKEAGTLATP